MDDSFASSGTGNPDSGAPNPGIDGAAGLDSGPGTADSQDSTRWEGGGTGGMVGHGGAGGLATAGTAGNPGAGGSSTAGTGGNSGAGGSSTAGTGGNPGAGGSAGSPEVDVLISRWLPEEFEDFITLNLCTMMYDGGGYFNTDDGVYICTDFSCVAPLQVDFLRPASNIQLQGIGVGSPQQFAEARLTFSSGSQVVVPVIGKGTNQLPTPIDLSSYSDVVRLELMNVVDYLGAGWDRLSFRATKP